MLARVSALLAIVVLPLPVAAQMDPLSLFGTPARFAALGSSDYALVDRPLTPPAGAFEAAVLIERAHMELNFSDDPLIGNLNRAVVGASYGITDELEAGLFTALDLDQPDRGPVIGIRAGIFAVETPSHSLQGTSF